MAVINTDFNIMNLPMAIERNNAIPLDSSAVWYSYEEMAAYAASGATAYVGQILSLVENGVANAYIITNVAGALEKVGSATVVDNKTIILDNGSIAFKDFGKRYYRYDKETEQYILQEVDDEHLWMAGLEPKVASEEGQLVLGWYEPNTTTIEGVNSTLGTLQTTVNDLQGSVSELSENTKEALKNVYNKDEVNSAIAAAVANAGQLSYKKVNSTDEIDLTDDKTIFLVPALEGLANDVYDEYMVIDGVLEKMGSWEVNLNDYATKEDLADKVDAQDGYSLVPDALIERLENIQPNAEQNFIKSVSSNFTVTDGLLELISLPSSVDLSASTVIQNLNKALEGKVDAEEGKSLVADDLIEKLIILDPNAEANVIDDVSDEFTVTGKTLSINTIDASKITNLSQLKEISDLISSVNTNTTNIASLNAIISQTEEDIATLRGEFRDTYVTKEKHNSDINALWEVLTWQELPE